MLCLQCKSFKPAGVGCYSCLPYSLCCTVTGLGSVQHHSRYPPACVASSNRLSYCSSSSRKCLHRVQQFPLIRLTGYSATPPFQLAPPPFPPRGYAPLTTFQVVDVPRQYRDTTLAAATPTALNDPHSRGAAEDGDDRRTTAARAATGTAGIAGTSMGGQYWPQPYTGPYGDFSRLLHSTDQLAQQLESAYARMSYLTQYAGGHLCPELPQLSAALALAGA